MPLNEEQQLRLDQEIKEERNNIRTDKLDISYGELANLYKNEELVIGPEYQRLFRWSSTQKTRFIESILLGFPTPAIFVAEDTQGVWELVDGLQRVSTVLEFMGVLKDGTGQLMPHSTLARVDAGHRLRLGLIDNTAFSELSLQSRLSIKRAGCRVEVIKVGSHPTMKYEVFERLNTGGSELSPQEVRNCIFRAANCGFVQWIEALAAFPPFADNLGLSEQQAHTMYDKGLVLRYLVMKHAYKEFEHDVDPFITDFIREVLKETRPFKKDEEDTLFKETFKSIGNAMQDDSWRHYRNGKHKGPLSVYVFEAVSVGVACNIDHIRGFTEDQLRERIVEFKQRSEFVNNTGAGANTKSKLQNRMDFARSFFGASIG